jgi:hypothetical protein
MMWPTQPPPITADEAVRATRRLWRFAMGETWRGPVKLTSGRNHTWERDGTLYVNPNKWEYMVSDLAWLFYRRLNTDRGSRARVAKLELKLIREVVKRGWLVNTLKVREVPPDVQIIMKHIEKENRTRKQLEAGVKRWTTKLGRAQTMLTKYERKLARYHKKGNHARSQSGST